MAKKKKKPVFGKDLTATQRFVASRSGKGSVDKMRKSNKKKKKK